MAEIVNLRRARKDRDRQAAERQATENRARFGQSKAAREATEQAEDQRNRLLDGARRED